MRFTLFSTWFQAFVAVFCFAAMGYHIFLGDIPWSFIQAGLGTMNAFLALNSYKVWKREKANLEYLEKLKGSLGRY